MTKPIFQYIRGKDGNLRGVVVALDRDHIGFSLCHPKTSNSRGDRFNKCKGLMIATKRAMNCSIVFQDELDYDIRSRLPKFNNRDEFNNFYNTVESVIKRAIKYYKTPTEIS